MKLKRPTFNSILETTAQENSKWLMAKARLANRLTKRSHGADRVKAYYVKSAALCHLVKKLADKVRISKDIRLTDFVVVELKIEQTGLHLPLIRLAE